jgi:aconitate hydratase
VARVYETADAQRRRGAQAPERPLTYGEKVFYGHLADPRRQELEPGASYVGLHPDRVAMQDATAQMALLQFMLAGRTRPRCRRTVHCDHLIQAHVGAPPTCRPRATTNAEVYEFLRSASGALRHRLLGTGRGHHPPGRARELRVPGGMMIGTDSHTPNAGGSACSRAASAAPTPST